jgi:hypothetical protein
LTVKYFIFRLVFPAPFWVGIFGGSSGEDPLCCITLLQVDPTGYVGNWLAVDLTGYNVVVSGDFYVAIQYSEDGMPDIGADLTSPEAPPRSYSGTPGSWTPFQDENARDLMIRAEVDAAPAAPVGGSVEPVSKLVIFAPSLALFGLVATIAIVVTAPWNRPDN